MSRIASLAAALLLLSATGAAAQLPADRTETDGVNLRLLRTDEPGVRTESMAAPPERVWAAIGDVYAELRIPGAETDAGRRVIAAVEQRVRRIGGRPVRAYFECGSAMGSPAADYDVYVTVGTLVDPSPLGSRVRTAASAYARGSAGSSTIPCTSTGALEERINQMVDQRVAQ